MAVPPFPSQDLAKLVLGYLAEEQLMTAYDEFLQASPYLDALRNEYDRIFMTSLRNILAEYRAVKIYVETCRPFALRKKLFQYTNLLDVIKCLVQLIDVNKLHAQEGTAERSSFENRSSADPRHACEVCNSLNCACKSRLTTPANSGHSTSVVEGMSLDSSVETTSLDDLPGNVNTTRKKYVKSLEKDSTPQLSCQSNAGSKSEVLSVASLDRNCSNSSVHSQRTCPDLNVITCTNNPKPTNTSEHQKIQEIASAVCNNNVTNGQVNASLERISTAGSFKDFATGVGGDNGNTTVPDSSTSENSCTQSISTKESHTTGNETNQARGVTKAHIFLKVGGAKNSPLPMKEATETPVASKLATLRPKINDQKITILSDIKVDKTFDSNQAVKMPQVLKNATSTPLMQMQTIMINGTPAYRTERVPVTCSFTKDEIMAMPTIILVPASGPPPVATRISAPIITQKHVTTSTVPSSGPLGPLVIDVSSESPTPKTITNSETGNTKEAKNDAMLIKTVDYKNASLPKDNVVDATKTNTPHMLPPTRKSSSTPRRTSHVRVLDFTTPRRILQETINEHVIGENCLSPVEMIVSRSPNLHDFVDAVTEAPINSVTATDKSDVANNTCGSGGSTKENNDTNKCINNAKYNWDADLRALAIANEKDTTSVKPKPKPKAKPKKKKPQSEMKPDEEKKTNVKRKTTKNKHSKNCDKLVEEPVVVVNDPVSVVSVKPTINIIPGSEWNDQEKEKSQNKSSEDQVDTPEMDRLSLQNAIGVKLNISDLLETPYKQALYDIQMETPRFLGPDLPGDPLSDIKIMNIPTPRFLNTPKPAQATPSSYSSRPTDYSSGGSYYKPDDQDYLPVEDLGYPAPSNEIPQSDPPVASKKDNKDKSRFVKTRPVRKCTKNVSYRNSPSINKTKEVDDNIEVASTCSESMSVNSSFESKDKIIKPAKENKKPKPEARKRNSVVKKRKTPVKKETAKTFMKIKPRRPTPTKESFIGRSKRRTSDSLTRKSNKDKHSHITPIVTSVPTKSRRKSSTPRKLHCTKTFNSESSGHDSPEIMNKKSNDVQESVLPAQDSDTDHLALRWSDDGSQETKSKDSPVNASVNANDSESIIQIQEYIATSERNKEAYTDTESSLHKDLVKRGFDVETAKIIERDLLDTPPNPKEEFVNLTTTIIESKKDTTPVEGNLKSDVTTHDTQMGQEEEEEEEEIELTVHECNEETSNYIVYKHDETKDTIKKPSVTLKDTYSMEVCIEDGVSIRLRATPFSVLLDQDPLGPDDKETEMAVNSISNIDKLYTPMKDSIKAQCYEIFDSTLTSLDTPMKPHSPRKEPEVTVTEIILEVEKLENKDKGETRKRKRMPGGNTSDESSNDVKKTKPETQYFYNSASIQNIDIETVLSKLHGP